MCGCFASMQGGKSPCMVALFLGLPLKETGGKRLSSFRLLWLVVTLELHYSIISLLMKVFPHRLAGTVQYLGNRPRRN